MSDRKQFRTSLKNSTRGNHPATDRYQGAQVGLIADLLWSGYQCKDDYHVVVSSFVLSQVRRQWIAYWIHPIIIYKQ